MKHWIHLIFCLLLTAGCGKRLAENSLELAQTEISCTCNGGNFKIGITGRSDWTTDNTADWVDVTRGKDCVLFKISHNEGEYRQQKIRFKLNGSAEAEIVITQEQSDSFSISTESITLGHKGGSIAVDISCFKEWTASSDADWIWLSEENGSGPQSITVKVSASEEPEDRNASIRFQCEDKCLMLNVMQKAKPFIELERDLVCFDGDGGQTQILYMSNTDVTVSSSDDWIRLIQTDGSVKKVSFEVKRNLAESREGAVILTSTEDSSIYQAISITQGPKIPHPKISIAEGTSSEISSKDPFVLHPEFEDMTDMSVNWKSDNDEIASVDAGGMVSVHSSGICTITASNSFHGVEASIKLDIKLKAQTMTVMLGMQNMNESPVAVRYAGESMNITVTMDPIEAYSEDLSYYSTDDSVAVINGNVIKCLKPGSTNIYIESVYQSIRQKYTLIVTE